MSVPNRSLCRVPAADVPRRPGELPGHQRDHRQRVRALPLGLRWRRVRPRPTLPPALFVPEVW